VSGSITGFGPQPGDHVGGVPVGREDRVEDALDPGSPGDERDPAVEPHAGDLTCREAERLCQQQSGVGDERVRDVRAGGELLLLGEM